jgi:glycosyltransferase involved in cell wall biosynthesis
MPWSPSSGCLTGKVPLKRDETQPRHLRARVLVKWWLGAFRPLLRRGAGRAIIWLSYVAHAWRLSARTVLRSRLDLSRRRVGFVTLEFFHEDLNGFGGYGKTVKNLTDALNGEGAGDIADVLITLPAPSGARLRRYHRADVVFSPGERAGLLRSGWNTVNHVWLLQRRMLDLLVTIEYYRAYERFLKVLPMTPIVVWIHDPRPEGDWEKIATMSLDVDGSKSGAKTEIARVQESIGELLDRSRAMGRRVVFAHQAACLKVKAKILYRLPSMESVFLPNPVEVAEETAAKTTEPTICMLGRLDPIKRPWIFFELAKRFPAVRFLVAGQTHFPEVMNPIIDRYRGIRNLEFLGMIGGQEKNALLQGCWGLVNTSIHEALPVSFLESLAAGTPIVSCQNPDGITERFGWYTGEIRADGVGEDTIQRFEAAISDLLSDRDAVLRKGAQGRHLVGQTYSYREFRTRLNAICRDL